MPEQTPMPTPQSTPQQKGRRILAVLLIALILAAVIWAIFYFSKKSAERDENFDTKAEATGITVDDALEEVYARSGAIVEVQATYIVLQSESVRNGSVYEQLFKVKTTDTTEYTERTFAIDSTDKQEMGMTRNALAVGDFIRASTTENIVSKDVFTATMIQRYQQNENSSQ